MGSFLFLVAFWTKSSVALSFIPFNLVLCNLGSFSSFRRFSPKLFDCFNKNSSLIDQTNKFVNPLSHLLAGGTRYPL